MDVDVHEAVNDVIVARGQIRLEKVAGGRWSLASELGPQGIRVNSVLPGYIWGGTLKGYFEHQAGKYGTTVDEIYNAAAVNSDLKRLPTEDEVASAILFMASDLSSGITGQTLDVNCGEYKA